MDQKSLNYFSAFWTYAFLDPQEFFKNRGLSFETSDSGFRDVLDELFHMAEKNQNYRSYFIVLAQIQYLN